MGATIRSGTMRRRLVSLAVTAWCVVVVVVTLAWVLSGSSQSGRPAVASTSEPQVATATVVRTDLVVEEETEATLVFTLGAEITAPAEGTATGVVEAGELVVAGTVVASIDGAPVVALTGDVPAWREMSDGVEDGVDIRQLEMNLVALGFDPDGEIEIDEHFDDATEDAVDLWEEALGLDADGVVDQSQVVFVSGDVVVDTVDVSLGGAVRDGDLMVSGRILDRRFDVAATLEGGGVVDEMATVGTPVETGTILFSQAGYPVAAVVGDVTSVPALDRELSVGVSSGADVKGLETVLAAGGFDADGALVVDDEFDDATTSAVIEWYEALGFPVAGGTEPDDVVVPSGALVTVPDGLSVTATSVAAGDTVEADRAVVTLGEVARLVEATVAVGDSDFELGATVDVEFPDDTVLGGEVVTVDTVLTSEPDGDSGAGVEVGIELHGDVPELFEQFVEVPVTILVPGDSALETLAVPVSSLVALAEGGYAVRVVAGEGPGGTTITELVAVETGLFADGLVAVTADGLAADDEVVVAS